MWDPKYQQAATHKSFSEQSKHKDLWILSPAADVAELFIYLFISSALAIPSDRCWIIGFRSHIAFVELVRKKQYHRKGDAAVP